MVALGMLILWAVPSLAQRGVTHEGAVYLLLPLGARIIAVGQTVASPDPSTEQLFWNPGAVGRARQREFAFHGGRFFVGPMSAFAGVFPLGRPGVIGVSAAVLDYGSQTLVTETGAPAGQVSQQSYIFAASYAATLGSRASLGFTIKNARFVGTCSGLCDDIARFDVSTTAVDAGLQYRVTSEDDLIIGATVRHVGPRFQLYDEPQADPLPSRAQLGASYRVRAFEREVDGTVLRVNADVIDRLLDPGSSALRFGVDVTWRSVLSARASYVDGSGEGTGWGIGMGVVTPRLTFDVAQTFGGASQTAASGSTYFSLRGRW
jgi:hypothetical protein